MLAQNYCQKVNLQSYHQLQIVREQFCLELEHSLRSLPIVTDNVPAVSEINQVDFEDRLDALCTLLKEKYQFEGQLYLYEESFDAHTDGMTDEERDSFTKEMVKEHGIVYNWIICCHYNRYNGFDANNFKSMEQILSFWTQRDFTDAFDDYSKAISEHDEVEIHVYKLERISVSQMSIKDWTL